MHMAPGASEVCKQSMESGTKYGQRKRTKEIVAWAKKKRRHIRREELLAFLLDKPYPDSSSLASANTANNSPENNSGSRKRVASSSNMFDFNMLGPDCKRMRF